MFDRITIKYSGHYKEWPLSDLDISSENPSDEEIRDAVMLRLDHDGLPVTALDGYVVDPPEEERLAGQHNDKTVLNIRPSATYG